MTRPNRPPVLAINVRLDSNVRTSDSEIRATTKKVGNGAARLILRQVAISASKRYEKQIGRTFQASVEKTVRSEFDRMARTIARSMIRSESSDGPSGAMNFGTGEGYQSISKTAKARGWKTNYNARQSGIRWAPRDPAYVRKKKFKEWWKKRGQLSSFMGKRDSRWYEKAFGPVRVRWTPTSESTRENTPVTSAGQRGPVQQRVRIGYVEVIAFGNITPQDLPGLAGFEPMTSPPTVAGGAGLASFLAAAHYNKSTAKLMQLSTGKKRVRGGYTSEIVGQNRYGKNKFKYTRQPRRTINIEREHRPWIDPFVSFFLTRSMPNAVWRRLEREFQSNARNQSKRSGVRDASGFGASI